MLLIPFVCEELTMTVQQRHYYLFSAFWVQLYSFPQFFEDAAVNVRFELTCLLLMS